MQHHGAREDGGGGGDNICTRQSAEQGENAKEEFLLTIQDLISGL